MTPLPTFEKARSSPSSTQRKKKKKKRHETEGVPSTVLLERDSLLHVVNDGDHLEVVLPGFGIARADKLYAKQLEQRQQSPQDHSAFGLKALTLALGLHAGDDGGEVLLNFLQLVGSSLRSLALYAVGSYRISMASISHACPQLTDLFLEGVELANANNFCRDAEQTDSKISCLGLVNAFSTNEQISRLAEELASPDNHLAQHLSELGLSGSEASCPVDETNVQRFLAMLQTNRKLSYLSLGLSPELQAVHDEAFRRHHGEPLPVVKEKLSTQCKIAFLSFARGGQVSNSAAATLDDGVLSLILAFAATCATRAVTIHFDD
ncbi:unnamed protein product [Phytophthora lilii]|uniref:Unnamed protein product n=1 Tax=Phytophthora lilii TaxID=2077276 RepID=A0A9W6WPT2_9STRA|nr:unnamed protein product [Phytophthora lilii]